MVTATGTQLGVLPLEEALAKAREAGLDLVEVAPNSDPPVCRIMDYGRFKFERSRASKSAKRASDQLKSVRFQPRWGTTSDHDFGTKCRQIQRFLKEGHRVRANIRLRGRQNEHPEVATRLLERLAQAVEGIGIVESPATRDGRTITMMLAPARGATT